MGLSFILIIIVLLVVLVPLFKIMDGFLKIKDELFKIEVKKQVTEFPYDSQVGLLTPAERSFFGILKKIIGEKAEIFVKVRLADVVKPKKGMSKSEWQKAFNKIASKHVDFLLCKRNDLSFICVIELDDKSHKKVVRQQRDKFFDGICEAAGIPLIRIPAKSFYVLDEVRSVLNDALRSKNTYLKLNAAKAEKEVQVNERSMTSQHSEKLCPKCNAPLVRRIAKSGKYAGKEFIVCSNYPKCRYIKKSEV